MTIEVVFTEIDQDSDRWVERRSEVDLIRRAFDDVHAIKLRRRQREDGGADIAAKLRVHPGRGRQMRDQRGRGRFAVSTGDGDEWSAWRVLPALAAEQFDVSDHLDIRAAGELHDPVRRRMGERNTGREHKRGNL